MQSGHFPMAPSALETAEGPKSEGFSYLSGQTIPTQQAQWVMDSLSPQQGQHYCALAWALLTPASFHTKGRAAIASVPEMEEATGSIARVHWVGEGRRELLLCAFPSPPASPLGFYPPLCPFFINKWKASVWLGDKSSLQTDSTEAGSVSSLHVRHGTWGNTGYPRLVTCSSNPTCCVS